MIELKNVCKSFDGRIVTNNVTFTLKTGSRTALTGPSGCGKTTLFRLIAGLDAPDSGTISVPEGTRFSAVFQGDRLCENLSLYANIKIACPAEMTKSDIFAATEELGLGGFENKSVSKLSGGMKRRACIIRAMLADFDVLFLDEPFNGLDRAAKESAAEFVLERLQGRTLILITHNPEDIALLSCDEISLSNFE